MTDIDLDKRFSSLELAHASHETSGKQMLQRIVALEAEVRALRAAMDTLIETAPTPEGKPAHKA